MGYAIVFSGLLMIVTGARGTYAQFGSQVAKDFSGPGNFVYWLVALALLGAIGYVDALRTFSRLMMALLLLSMLLANRGFFKKLTDALTAGPTPPDAPAAASAASNPSGQGFVSDKPWLDAGPLGTINPQIIPGSPLDKLKKLFGY